MAEIFNSKGNAALLYQLIHDIIKENPIYTQDLVGVLETIKLEFVIDAIDETEEIEDDED